jgi:glycosyltransferase involved in cell wall biosynthesis
MIASTYRASVLLAAKDQADMLLRSLSTVARLGDDAGFEAVVVDDGSRDHTADLLAGIDGDFQALTNLEPQGWGLAMDRAVAVARGEHVILLREDVIPVDGWFDALLARLDLDPDCGAVRARGVRLDGSVLDGDAWACLAVRRRAFADVGGFAGTSRPGRAEKATFLAGLLAAGWTVADAPEAVVLVPAQS